MLLHADLKVDFKLDLKLIDDTLTLGPAGTL